MKKFTSLLIILILLVLATSCEKPSGGETPKKEDKTGVDTSQTETEEKNDNTELDESKPQNTDPSENQSDDNSPNEDVVISGEKYTLYYVSAGDSTVAIAGFKNAENQSMSDTWIDIYKNNYNMQEIQLPGSNEIVIPETIEGKAVVNIDMKAFDNCDSIISVTIPECCTNIEAGVFTFGCREDIIIYGAKGSEAEAHAEEYGLTFCEK